MALSLFLFLPALGQDIAIGTWRTHFNYKNIQVMQETETKVFCAAENGFFSYDFVTGETRKLSKIDGLSDIGVTAMAYSTSINVLILGYKSGIIDLIFENETIGLTAIATSNLNRGKTINKIFIKGSNAYLASDFGIIVIDLIRAEISANFLQIGTNGVDAVAEDILIRDDSIFVLTKEGIQVGNLTDNLLDFNNWKQFSGTSTVDQLVHSETGLYALNNTRLLRLSGRSWVDSGIELPTESRNLISIQDRLFTSVRGLIYELNGNFFEMILSTKATTINDLALDMFGNVVIGTETLGLLDEEGIPLSPKGPIRDDFYKIKIVENQVYAFYAPNALSYDGSEQVIEYSLFSDGSWENQSIEGFTNVSDVGVFKNKHYFTSIGDGLYIEGAGIIKDIPNSDTALDTVLTSIEVTEGILLTGFGDQPLHLLFPSGEWNSYSNAQMLGRNFKQVKVSERGVVWMLTAMGTISVFDVNENNVAQLSKADGIPASIIDFDLSVEDNAWLATDQGPALLPYASLILLNSEVSIPTFENRILFEKEKINSIATDGGNRVWFGTNRGLWVFDENTSEQVALFNISNSPIPSNQVLDLTYNEANGEIFIATAKGLVSYRSVSSLGSSSHMNVKIFPNPVRPEYQGVVGLSGLANNAQVTITDINGNLVAKVQANGGTASWDLRNNRGSRVVTGIYYFFSISDNREDTFVGKLAVVR